MTHAIDSTSRRVLIVDDNSDSLDVLQTTLERRGIRTLITQRAEEGLDLAEAHRPDLILLDMETVPSEHRALCQEYDQTALRQNASLVLVARSRRDHSGLHSSHVLSKPYHYAPLVRKIEELLDCNDR